MTLLNWIFVAWSVVTTALVLLLIYRSTVAMKEDDQLFLDPAERQLEEEQKEIRRTLDRLSPAVRALGFGSGGLAMGMVGTVVYTVIQTL